MYMRGHRPYDWECLECCHVNDITDEECMGSSCYTPPDIQEETIPNWTPEEKSMAQLIIGEFLNAMPSVQDIINVIRQANMNEGKK